VKVNNLEGDSTLSKLPLFDIHFLLMICTIVDISVVHHFPDIATSTVYRPMWLHL